MAEAVVRITVTDLLTGESATKDVIDNDYFILTTGDCHVANTQVYPGVGTHILTIRGRKNG